MNAEARENKQNAQIIENIQNVIVDLLNQRESQPVHASFIEMTKSKINNSFIKS